MERIVGITTRDEGSVEDRDGIHATRCIVDVERGLLRRLLPRTAVVRPGCRAIVFVADQDGLVSHGGDSDWSCSGDRRSASTTCQFLPSVDVNATGCDGGLTTPIEIRPPCHGAALKSWSS